jgi:hypothetical protein
MGTMHLNWILSGPSFAVYREEQIYTFLFTSLQYYIIFAMFNKETIFFVGKW